MILELFGFMMAISLVLIAIGLTRPSESGAALIGFFLFFIFGLIILDGKLEYRTGADVNSQISYNTAGNINGTTQSIVQTYTYYSDGNTHIVGWVLALMGVIGFIGVLFSYRRSKRNDED